MFSTYDSSQSDSIDETELKAMLADMGLNVHDVHAEYAKACSGAATIDFDGFVAYYGDLKARATSSRRLLSRHSHQRMHSRSSMDSVGSYHSFTSSPPARPRTVRHGRRASSQAMVEEDDTNSGAGEGASGETHRSASPCSSGPITSRFDDEAVPRGDELEETFNRFCQYGSFHASDGSDVTTMSGSQWTKLCKDAGLISKYANVSRMDCDIIFMRVARSVMVEYDTVRKLNYRGFQRALLEVGRKLFPLATSNHAWSATIDLVLAGRGPRSSSSAAQAHRL